MPTPNASISRSPGAVATEKSRANDRNRMGLVHMTPDAIGSRKPEFYIGIFNVSTKSLTVQRQWGSGQSFDDFGSTAPSISGLVTIPGREPDELYSRPYVLRDIERLTKLQPSSDEIVMIPVKGEFLAQDLCNCLDPFGDWRTARILTNEQQNAAGSVGNNYYERGIFWCKLATPDAEPDLEAVEKAVERLEAYYQKLYEEGNRYYQLGPKGQELIAAPHHEAIQYFLDAGHKIEAPWHMTLTGGLRGKLAEKIKAKQAAAEAPAPVIKK